MKCRLFISGLLMLLALASSKRVETATPETVIKDFCKWYINTVEAKIDPLRRARAAFNKYVTVRLIRQDERSESEPDEFLETQEWDASWANRVIISNLIIKPTNATASVTLTKRRGIPVFGLR